MSMSVVIASAEGAGQGLELAPHWGAMVRVVVEAGYHKECTEESTQKQLGTTKIFEGSTVYL